MSARPASPSPGPPLPLGRYVHLLAGLLLGAEVAESDPTARHAVERLHPSPAESSAARSGAPALRERFPADADDLPDLPALPADQAVALGLSLAAQVRHLLLYWAPVLDLGRKGEFKAHAGDLRRAASRLEAVERALRAFGEPACLDTARRLVAVLAEVQGAFPLETARSRAAPPPGAAQGGTRRDAPQDPSSTTSIAQITGPQPPSRLRMERREAEERRRALLVGVLVAAAFAFVVALAFLYDPRVEPREDRWYRRYAPVLQIDRRPLLYEVRLDPEFAMKAPDVQRAQLEPLIQALKEERRDFTVVTFVIQGREIARWEDGRLTLEP